MNNIAIYGAGGLGREVALMIHQINSHNPDPWKIVGFYDDAKSRGTTVDDYAILGGINDVNVVTDPLAIAIAVADPVRRAEIKARIMSSKITFPTLIHPSANMGDVKRNRFGDGVLVTAGNILTTAIHIDAFVIINLGCTIGHDVRIGAFSTIMPGCSLSGFVKIGAQVLVGSGARILPGKSVGNNSKVGAGAVVLDDVVSGVTVVGVPAKVVKGEGGKL